MLTLPTTLQDTNTAQYCRDLLHFDHIMSRVNLCRHQSAFGCYISLDTTRRHASYFACPPRPRDLEFITLLRFFFFATGAAIPADPRIYVTWSTPTQTQESPESQEAGPSRVSLVRIYTEKPHRAISHFSTFDYSFTDALGSALKLAK